MSETFEKITFHKAMTKDDGKSKGFGFVAYDNTDDGESACSTLNRKELADAKDMVVGEAQKKAERQKDIKNILDELKTKRPESYQGGVNLYVKNLDSTVDNEILLKHFSRFGTITSAKVMMDEEGRSKGFGFVCFNLAEGAIGAVTELNGTILGSKPLYVALAQRKEDRKAHLAAQYLRQMSGKHVQTLTQIFPPNTSVGGTLSQPIRGSVRDITGQQAGGAGAAAIPIAGTSVSAAGRNQLPANYKYMSFRNKPIQQPVQQIPKSGNQEPLLATLLANAPPQDQKQILGERLFPLIERMYSQLAGKITHMLLEMENSELLHIIENQIALKAKVEETISVLQLRYKISNKIE